MPGTIDMQILGNSLYDWALALSVFVLLYVAYGLIKRFLLKKLPSLENLPGQEMNRLVQDLLKRTKAYLMFLLLLFLTSLLLTLPSKLYSFLRILAVVSFIIQTGFWGMGLVDYLIQRRIRLGTEDEKEAATTMTAVNLVSKIAIWSIAILLILENVTGLQMDTLIATLGITGVAVALAVQNILGDLFSSISIALDKPFTIGDAIVVGNFSGNVEHIGLKSTRVRSLSGEQIIFSNSDLLKSRIQNFKRLERRLVGFSLGVSYDTPNEKLAAIPGMLEEIISKRENVTFSRAHLKALGDYALNFECVYYIDVPDFSFYMDTLHSVNLAIHKRFEEEAIDMPYPTQTVITKSVSPPSLAAGG
jgi:small-conductance mechanosensitive channel